MTPCSPRGDIRKTRAMFWLGILSADVMMGCLIVISDVSGSGERCDARGMFCVQRTAGQQAQPQ